MCSTLFGQTGTIKVKKTLNDSLNLIGTWVPIYDKSKNDSISRIPTKEVDTLTFFPDKKYLIQQTATTSGIWEIDQKNKLLYYKSGTQTFTMDGQTIDIAMPENWERIKYIKNDTMTFIRALEETPKTEYKTRYYIRQK